MNGKAAAQVNDVSRGVRLAFGLVLATAIAFAFWPTGDCRFVFDDITLIGKNRAVLAGDLWSALTGRHQVMGNRPITNFSLALQYALFGQNAVGFRCVSLLLHAINARLVFLVIRATLLSPNLAGRFTSRRAWLLAAAATTLWSVHPLAVDAVAYTIQQSMLLMAMCALGAVLLL